MPPLPCSLKARAWCPCAVTEKAIEPPPLLRRHDRRTPRDNFDDSTDWTPLWGAESRFSGAHAT
jgi:hypothetical protein